MSAPWLLTTLALFALAAHPLWLLGLPLPPWLLAACGLAALPLARRELLPPRLGSIGLAALLSALAAITWGSVATDSRVWDGFVAWGATAKWLALDGSLQQPVFADGATYLPSRGYPLLQPALLAQTMAWFGPLGGRLLFPCLWLSMLFAVARTLHARSAPLRTIGLCAAALALLPAMTEGREGAADSGYADLLVAVLLTHAAAALLRERTLPFALACLLLPLTKNEGLVHAGVLVACAAARGGRAVPVAGAIGAAAGLLLWAPLQARLAAPGSAPGWTWLALPLVPLAALAFGVGLARPRWRLPLALGSAAVAAAVVALGGLAATSLGAAIENLARLRLPWADLPRIAGRVLYEAVHPVKVGLTFLLPAAAAALLRRRGMALGDAGALLAAIGLGVLAIFVFVALGPAHLRSDFLRTGVDRYIAQWVGVAWLTAGALLARLAPPAAAANAAIGAHRGS
ncbi:MAG: hypothetical protein ACK6D1_05410 [Planctomycetota bacterium]